MQTFHSIIQNKAFNYVPFFSIHFFLQIIQQYIFNHQHVDAISNNSQFRHTCCRFMTYTYISIIYSLTYYLLGRMRKHEKTRMRMIKKVYRNIGANSIRHYVQLQEMANCEHIVIDVVSLDFQFKHFEGIDYRNNHVYSSRNVNGS